MEYIYTKLAVWNVYFILKHLPIQIQCRLFWRTYFIYQLYCQEKFIQLHLNGLFPYNKQTKYYSTLQLD